jgi:hypothetical protein
VCDSAFTSVVWKMYFKASSLPSILRRHLEDIFKGMPKQHKVRQEQRLIGMQQRAEWEPQEVEQSNYIENWIARQPDDKLRQQFADGLLSCQDAENLIAAAALDDLLGPAYDYRLCDVCYHRPSSHPHHGCEEWETQHLAADIYPAWQALKAKLPEGTKWSFYEVFPCLLKRLEQPSDPHEEVGALVYVAKLTVPVGPFRFERTILLSELSP